MVTEKEEKVVNEEEVAKEDVEEFKVVVKEEVEMVKE